MGINSFPAVSPPQAAADVKIAESIKPNFKMFIYRFITQIYSRV